MLMGFGFKRRKLANFKKNGDSLKNSMQILGNSNLHI